jgi:hypothetical protein
LQWSDASPHTLRTCSWATPSAGAPDLGRDTHEVSLGRATLDDREAAWRAALAAAPHHPVVLDAWARELAARYVLGPGRGGRRCRGGHPRGPRAAGTPLALAHLDAAASSRLSLRLASTCRPWSASTSARRRRTCGGCSTRPRMAGRSCSSTRPTPCSASAPR